MSGPVAPKDPEKDRSYFYIMKEKETFGSLQTQGEYQGRGVQFIYESDGRLESSAEVTGEVCDEEILKKLGTVEGFKSLVHSIGISVEMEHSREPVTFVFQMYGKEDLYGGGTLIETELRGDGAEVRITLDTVKWKTDDDVPGQIRFVFETPEQSARVNVRFFLKDGFFVPKPQEERVVDMESHGYQEMIERSLLSTTGQKSKKVMTNFSFSSKICHDSLSQVLLSSFIHLYCVSSCGTLSAYILCSG